MIENKKSKEEGKKSSNNKTYKFKTDGIRDLALTENLLAHISLPYYEESLGKRCFDVWGNDLLFSEADKIKQLVPKWIDKGPLSDDEKSQVKKCFQDWITGIEGKFRICFWIQEKISIISYRYDNVARDKIKKWMEELFNTPYKE